SQEKNSVLDRFHQVVNLVNDRPDQPSGDNKLFHLEHAPFQLQLFELVPYGKITQNRDCIGDLSECVIDLAGTRRVLNFTTHNGIEEMERLILMIEKRER